MNGGILHSAAALDLLSKIQDARAQNLANADTAGYRRRVASADAFAASLRAAAGIPLPGMREAIDFSQGDLRHTGQDLDLAIEGKGFFALETPAGPRFTRNGSFHLDAEGYLVAHDGARVQGETGPLQADPARGPLTVDAAGNVVQQDERIGRLRVVAFADEARLQPEAAGRFRETPGAEPREALEANVRQGYLEVSNVSVVDELVQMIGGFRAFEAAQKALVGIDRVRGEHIQGR